jgi:hypothetical protein
LGEVCFFHDSLSFVSLLLRRCSGVSITLN